MAAVLVVAQTFAICASFAGAGDAVPVSFLDVVTFLEP